MLEDMYVIMDRINELQKRFGLVRRQPVEVQQGNREARQKERSLFQHHLDRATGNQVGKADQQNPSYNAKTVTGQPVFGHDRASIDKAIKYYAGKNGLPARLVRAVVDTESSFNPGAVSNKGAMGLMQLMPPVLEEMNVKNPFSVDENLNAGTRYLRGLLERYRGDYPRALAAYNAGPGAVDESGGVPDYPETEEFVRRVMSRMRSE
jgi:soluble lytic murein transglycosylase-like protein